MPRRSVTGTGGAARPSKKSAAKKTAAKSSAKAKASDSPAPGKLKVVRARGASARAKAKAASRSTARRPSAAKAKAHPDGTAPAGNGHGRHLVIVESPHKARTITKFLGRGYTVMASNGHIMDLPTSKLGVDIENDFQPEYVTIRGKLKILKDLKTRSRTADIIYMAPDPDREGEAIAWHLARYLKGNGTIRRLTFNEITERAIKEAILHPRDIDENLVNAQQARRVLDRLVGYKVSPLLWTILRYGLSAGRVQSVALRILCDREKEIKAFTPEEYWTIDALLANHEEAEFSARLQKIGEEKVDLRNEPDAARIVAALKQRGFAVDTVRKQQRKKQPSAPFITSTLQQEAFKKLRYSSQKTMVLAQQLYEGIDLGDGPVGLITYMRTDSTRIAGEAIDAVRSYIGERYGEPYLPETARFYASKKSAQDAHEAVRPTDVTLSPDRVQKHLTPELFRLYVLIWNRFVSSQMTPAVYETTSVDIVARAGAGETAGRTDVAAAPLGDAWLRASGTVPVFDGFTRVWGNGEDETEPRLPALSDGEPLRLRDVVPAQHFTEPPPRYTEATLVKALEENGIGRPSTYATIVSTIINRDYVVRDRGKLTPTDLGMTVTDLLVRTFPDIFNIAFTARMEDDLDKIETGEDEWRQVVREFWDPFSSDLSRAESQKEDLRKGVQEVTDIDCPKCGAKMIKKYGRNGVFLACPNYPECKTTRPFDEGETEQTDEVCEKCGSAMVVKRGRYGRFLACSQYPDCKNARPFKIGVPCPEKDCPGSLVEKRSKRGKVFYGCDQYPACTFATWDRPVQVECPQCGNPFMSQKESKSKGQYLKCPKCRAEVVSAETAE